MCVEILLTLIQFGYNLADDYKDGFGDVLETHFLLVFEALNETEDVIAATVYMSGLEVADKLRPGDVLTGFELLFRAEKGLDLYALKYASQTDSLVEVGLEDCGDIKYFR